MVLKGNVKVKFKYYFQKNRFIRSCPRIFRFSSFKRMRINYRSPFPMSQKEGYNKPGFWTFVIVLVGNLVFFTYISFFHPGVKEHSLNLPGTSQAK